MIQGEEANGTQSGNAALPAVDGVGSTPGLNRSIGIARFVKRALVPLVLGATAVLVAALLVDHFSYEQISFGEFSTRVRQIALGADTRHLGKRVILEVSIAGSCTSAADAAKNGKSFSVGSTEPSLFSGINVEAKLAEPFLGAGVGELKQCAKEMGALYGAVYRPIVKIKGYLDRVGGLTYFQLQEVRFEGAVVWSPLVPDPHQAACFLSHLFKHRAVTAARELVCDFGTITKMAGNALRTTGLRIYDSVRRVFIASKRRH